MKDHCGVKPGLESYFNGLTRFDPAGFAVVFSFLHP